MTMKLGWRAFNNPIEVSCLARSTTYFWSRLRDQFFLDRSSSLGCLSSCHTFVLGLRRGRACQPYRQGSKSLTQLVRNFHRPGKSRRVVSAATGRAPGHEGRVDGGDLGRQERVHEEQQLLEFRADDLLEENNIFCSAKLWTSPLTAFMKFIA